MPTFTTSIRTKFLAACAIALVSNIGTALPAHAEGDYIRVFMNHARVLKLDRAVSKVIVGDSQVADATVADSKTIVLTGRSFGTTNLVLLDAAGNAIVDDRILVSIDEGDTVRIYRQTERSVYSCTPNCEKHMESSGGGTSSAATTAAPATSMAQ
jgi:Flp pilus assembly secretin CpaC